MGFLDNLRSAFSNNNTQAKAPTLNVTGFTKNNLFESLLNKDTNYLDQYVYYTYKSIDLISDSVASNDIFLMAGNDVVENDPLLNDLQKFNPWMTLYDARKLKETHLRLTGAAFWYIATEDLSDGHQKAEFYPLNPTEVEIKTDNFGLISYYQYSDGDGLQQDIPKENIVYFRRLNHKNWIKGYSQVEAMLNIHNAYTLGTQYNVNTFANNNRFDFLLEILNINEDQRLAIESDLRQKYGGTKNAAKGGVVNTEVKVHRVSDSNRDLDYVEGMKMLRQDILAMYGIPEALMFPSATNANTEESIRIFQRFTIKPALRQEQETLNEQLIKHYYEGASITGTYYFDFSNPVDADQVKLSDIAKKGIEGQYMTINEARELIGLEHVEGGNVFIQPTTVAQATEVEDKGYNEDLQMIVKSIDALEAKIDSHNKLTEADKEKQRLAEETIEIEQQMFNVTTAWFQSQAIRMASQYKDKKPTLSGFFNTNDENRLAVNHFKDFYDQVGDQVATSVNVEVRSKLFKNNDKRFVSYKDKGLTMEALKILNQRADVFASDINKTTREQLKKVIAEGIKNELSSRQVQAAIVDVYNKYIEGSANVDTLTKLGVYIENVAVNTEGNVVISSNNRYNAMFEQISNNLTGAEQQQAAKALRGITQNTTDPVAKQVDQLLQSFYGVTPTETISDYRAQLIARTETTNIRNAMFTEQYNNNEFVKGLKWNSINQPGVTRESHLVADNQVVPKGTAFVVGGEKLKYPGDTSLGASADNVINCRCRVTAEV